MLDLGTGVPAETTVFSHAFNGTAVGVFDIHASIVNPLGTFLVTTPINVGSVPAPDWAECGRVLRSRWCPGWRTSR